MLRIIYGLFWSLGPAERHKFIKDHDLVNIFYEWVMERIGNRLGLAVKRCVLCGIEFLPDYRTAGHQKCCPYGCVEDNHRRNVKAAKERYRGKREARIAQSRYNREYRMRRKGGEVEEEPHLPDREREAAKLKKRILDVYRRMRPGVGEDKFAQLGRILDKVSEKTKNERDRVWTRLAGWSRIGWWP